MLATPMLRASVGERSSAHTGVTRDPNIFFGWCFKPTPRRGSSVEVAATRGHDTKGLADSFQRSTERFKSRG